MTTSNGGSTESGLTLQHVEPDDWESHRAIRLEMLLDAPDAFWFTHAEESVLPEARWREQLEGSWVVQARQDGAVLGSAGLGPHWEEGREETATLWGMYVTPSARGRGIGELLVHAVLEEARRRGHADVVLEVVNTNAAAITLYERCGFEATGNTSPHPRRSDIHEIEMVCTLDG